MSTTPISPLPQGLADGLKALRAKWGWIVALGVVFLVAGVIAMGSVVAATETAVLVVGIMMLMGGVAEIIAAFSVKTWGKFLLWMLLGVLYVAAGMIAIMNPLLAAAYLTLMLGFALVFGGVLRIFLAFQMKSAGGPWGWVVLSGLITLLLGAMIIASQGMMDSPQMFALLVVITAIGMAFYQATLIIERWALRRHQKGSDL